MSNDSQYSDWGGFGDLVFKGRLTPKSMQSSRAWRVNASQVINGYPFHQIQGEDEHTVSIEMQFHNQFCDLTKSSNQLEVLAESEQPRALVIGDKSYGLCIVKRLAETGMKTMPNGTIISITYQVDAVEVRS